MALPPPLAFSRLRLVPATLAFAADGTPWSRDYEDVYHSAAGGIEQARHVFLGGNALPARWQGRAIFTILETGFGFGLNFLAAWQAWRDDSRRCARLHFVSIEKHPFNAADLATLLARFAQSAPLASRLLAAWPMLLPGIHRLEFDDGQVVLSLVFADAADGLRQLRVAADAIFLDGFAPSRNPQMWSAQAMNQVARLAAPGATASTWSVAGDVRDALESAGFDVEKRPGFAAKREMLVARLRRGVPDAAGAQALERSAMVIGAGIAGAAVSERLAARGWRVTLLERHAAPAAEGSGNHAGVFHPLISPDDNLASRLTRAAFLHWLQYWRRFEADSAAQFRSSCGALQLARFENGEQRQRSALAALDLPAAYARGVGRAEASDIAGLPVAAGGLWFPAAGWIRPRMLVAALLARCGERLQAQFGREVSSLARVDRGWIARDCSGATLAEAPVAVLANAADALRLAPSEHVRMRRVRGQVTLLPGARFAALRTVVLRGGFLLPPVEGVALAGASYDFDDEDALPRADGHAGNLERIEAISPGAGAGFDPAALAGRVSWRAVAGDRLPLIGALADERGARNGRLARMPGLYGAFGFGSRGLLWAGLGAELLASMLEGDPLPVEAALADAVDPGRFMLRAMRRAGSAAGRRARP